MSGTAPAAGTGHRIAIVIPNLDGAHWLGPCLASIAAGDTSDVLVIVADDGSDDESRAVSAATGATFLAGPARGTGFAATANRGIAAAEDADWVMLLNNDTEIAPDFVAEVRAAMRRHPDAAMIAPLVRSLRNRNVIDSAGLVLFPDGTARPRWHGRSVASVTPSECAVLAPSGAAALYRRAWLDRTGRLDEAMHAYGEDLDLALRIGRAGGSAVLAPRAQVFHHFSGTTGAVSPNKARLIEQNHIVIAARHLPWSRLLLLPAWTLLRWTAALVGVLRSHDTSPSRSSTPALARAVLAGTVSGLARLPRALRERRRLTASATVRGADWARLLRRHRARLRDYLRFGE